MSEIQSPRSVTQQLDLNKNSSAWSDGSSTVKRPLEKPSTDANIMLDDVANTELHMNSDKCDDSITSSNYDKDQFTKLVEQHISKELEKFNEKSDLKMSSRNVTSNLGISGNRGTGENPAHKCNENFSLTSDKSALDSISVQPIPKKVDKDDTSSSEFSDYSSDDEAIHDVDDLLENIINQVHKNDWLGRLKHKLGELLTLSNKKFVSVYVIEVHCNVLKTIMDALDRKPQFMGLFLNVILRICERYDKAIDLIGSDKEFVKKILSCLQSMDILTLSNLLKLLKLVMREIQIDCNSCWVKNLQEFGFFGYCISNILRFSNNETLLITTIELVKDVSNIMLPNKDNFMKSLFKMNHLISVLRASCGRTMSSKRNSDYSRKFIQNWLSVMINIKKDIIIAFEESEEREKYNLLEILFIILEPYEETKHFPLEMKQDFDVISKSTRLLLYFYRRFYIPSIMDRIVMKITLKFNLDVNSVNEKTDSQKSLDEFLKCMEKLWLCIVECREPSSIVKLIESCKPDEYQYLRNLACDNPRIQNKLKMIDANLKKETFQMTQ